MKDLKLCLIIVAMLVAAMYVNIGNCKEKEGPFSDFHKAVTNKDTVSIYELMPDVIYDNIYTDLIVYDGETLHHPNDTLIVIMYLSSPEYYNSLILDY